MANLQENNQSTPEKSRESLISDYLDHKLISCSQTTRENSLKSVESKGKRRVMPDYKFIFKGHTVGESVQYEVEMIESFKVFGRVIEEKYQFKTRYSKLNKLSEKVGKKGFPAKKWWGNKDSKLIEERKRQLENYLNEAVKAKCPAFLEFILQVKQINLMSSNFKLPK